MKCSKISLLSEVIGRYLLDPLPAKAHSSDSFRQTVAMRSDSLRKVPTKDVAAEKSAAYAGPMPGKPFQSKLVPYESLIRDLRAAGRTYREISEILKKEHRVTAHPDTINSFVIVRAKGAKVYALPAAPQAPAETPAAPSTAEPTAEPSQESSGFFDAPTSKPPTRRPPKYKIEL